MVRGELLRGVCANMNLTDNVLITKTGYENLTTAVKEIAEMEKIISS